MRFDYRILGAVEVLRDGEAVRLGGRKQRTLLALLALQPGEPVAADGLIEALWPRYDEAARSRLQVNVSQLRSALGEPAAIGHGPGGYTLAAEPEAVDAVRFEAVAREGRAALAAGDPERAERVLREALAMWRGPALGDLAYEPFAQAAVRGLEELRLGALEDRIEADLALGRHRELVAELEPLVAEQPVRERLRGALMLALYRCGRQADALDAYLAARRTLVDELGVEPGPELQRLHAAILEQDATLLVDPAEVRARRHLPAPATALVGRRAQLADLDALLRRDGVRLVTLTGVGGAGKTRLALAVAAGLADRFEHGVYFAALAPEKDPELVPDAIAAALGVDERPGEPIAATLASYLRDRRLLLVTDNFEHVDEAAPVVSELLAAAPGLKVLATSRSPLRLYGEHEYPVPPLEDAEAIDLFVVRARAARHAFQLGAADAAAVVEICARLDGLPLAIELAAARSRTLAPSEMVAALPRLELAAEGPRDVPERQRTLRATLDWSHALLTGRERELFAGLGVFVGGCDAEAALAVCGAGEPELELLAEESLLEHSGARFAMLETVREYALERLGESGLSDDLCARHAEHYAALAELAEPELTADRRGSLLLRLEAEHPNFRAALTWCARSGAIALELRLVAALTRFWVVRGHLREGRAWLDSALSRAAAAPPELRAKALAGGASVTFWQGDYDGLKAFAREGLALCEQVGDKRGMAQALDRLGTAIANEGDHAGGMELYERSLALCREIDDVRMLAISTTNVGCLAMMQGDYERAEVLSRDGLELHERAGQRDGMQQPLFNLGLIALLTGRPDEALAIFDDGLAQAEELGFLAGTFYVMEGQAAAYAARGEHERAAARLGAAAAAAEQAGGAPLEPFEQELHDRTVSMLRAALGDAAYEAAFAGGAGDASEVTVR